MGKIPTGIVQDKATTQGTHKGPKRIYIAYEVANADGTPGKDFDQFKKHCSVMGMDDRYADRVRLGQTNGGPFGDKVKGLMDAIDADALEVQVPKKGKGQ